ncbi:MAG TPA: hypothetical protein VH374_08695 [Polyangia bacterium]|jgi:cytochrome c553|nr:hypothetical protein [Polyangia bacterium]
MISAGSRSRSFSPALVPALFVFGVGALAACGSSSQSPSDGFAGGDVTADAADLAPSDGADDVGADVANEEDPPVDAAADVKKIPAPQPYPRPSYQDLSETGLYADFANKVLSDGLVAFEPTHKLWSDGATKRRWIKLPPDTQIDTSDMDHWIFPVGTKLFKEFSLGGVLLETRLVERYGAGPEDYWFGAFVWNADQTDAVFAVDGQQNINGTMHDAPSQMSCGACHRGDLGRVLGFSAIQLSRPDNEPTLKGLATAGLLTNPPPPGVDYPVLGDDVSVAALGYLHANCGHCHNMNGTSWPDTQMVLRLTVADRDLRSSGLYESIVGQTLQYFRGGGVTMRVSPGDPDNSAVMVRMQSRTEKIQMPPLATEIVDPDGVAAVRAWITSLPAPASPDGGVDAAAGDVADVGQ